MIFQKFVVLAGAGCDVENRACARSGHRNDGAQNLALVRVILEVIDGIVEFGTFEEHRRQLTISRGGFTVAGCGKNLMG